MFEESNRVAERDTSCINTEESSCDASNAVNLPPVPYDQMTTQRLMVPLALSVSEDQSSRPSLEPGTGCHPNFSFPPHTSHHGNLFRIWPTKTGRRMNCPVRPIPDAPVTHVEQVMGTAVSFAIHPGPLAGVAVTDALRRACDVLHQADALFSTWIPHSPLSRLRRGQLSLAECPDEFEEVLRLCAVARDTSGGWFDPWAMPGGFDPTGLVKGWAVERALDPLVGAGVKGALVNGGGDIATWGNPPSGVTWRIGIRHPWREQGLACVITVDAAVATSGVYERGLHLVDPHTRQPEIRAASATVTGPTLALADAYATAVAVGGDPAFDLIDGLDGYAAYLIRPDGSERFGSGITVVS